MMNKDPSNEDIPLPSQTAFQIAAGDVLAQRLEAIASEVRAIGSTNAGIYASGETLGLLASVLQITLRRIEEVFEYEGFVFTPACSLLLELFRARTRGSTVSMPTLCQSLSCSASLAARWVTVLESWQLVEKFGSGDDARVSLTEKGNLKTIEALRLLL